MEKRNLLKKNLLIYFLIFLGGPLVSFGEELSELERKNFVRKCFAQLSGERIPRNSEYLQRVLTEDPAVLCMEILERASFQSNGQIKEEEKSSVGQLVLKNMNRLHSTFFSSRRINGFGIPTRRASKNYFDQQQPAFYITNTLFNNLTYKNAVTRSTALKAVRSDNDPKFTIWDERYSYDTCETKNDTTKDCGRFLPKVIMTDLGMDKLYTNSSCKENPDQEICKQYKVGYALMPLAPRGKLYGLVSHTGVNVPEMTVSYQGSTIFHEDHTNLVENQGGGILGDTVYLQSNISIPSREYKADGSAQVSRNWAKAVYEDLLCRNLPALRSEDVQFQISNLDGSSAFRWSSACLRCHVGMDQTAGAVRNLQWVLSGSNFDGGEVTISPRLKEHTISNSEAWVETPDANWHEKSPFSRLYYRDYKGDLIHRSAEDLNALGDIIGETDDYYICAAKRYYKHFMKVDVSLADPGRQPEEVTGSEHKAEVIRLGLDFKEHRSLKKLIEGIFKSKFYYSGKSNG